MPQTAARAAEDDRVEVDARYHGREQHGEASFHADEAQRREWASATMPVAPDGEGSG